MRTAVTFFGALVLGLVLGFWMRGWVARPDKTVSTTTLKMAPAPGTSLPLSSSGEREKREKTGTLITGNYSLLRALRDLSNQQLLMFHVRVLGPHERLSPGIAALLGISGPDEKRMNDALTNARVRLAQTEAGVASVARGSSPDELIVTIPAFPQQGGPIYDELMAQVGSILGPEREALWRDFGEQELDNQFNGFGVNSRLITIHRISTDGRVSYELNDQRRDTVMGPSGHAEDITSSSSGARVPDHAALVKNLGLLGEKVIPAEY